MEPLVPVLWQDGKDNSGWPVVCVPPGRAAEIIVTIEVCERTGREKKLSVVRQGGGLLKVYVNPEVGEPDEREVEGNSARLLVGTPEWLRKASVKHVRAGGDLMSLQCGAAWRQVQLVINGINCNIL